MSDDRPVTGFDPPIGAPPGSDEEPDDDGEYVTEWNWPFIGGAVAVVVVLGALVAFLTLRSDDEPPSDTTTTTESTSTTMQLSTELTMAELMPLDIQFGPLWELAAGTETGELLAGDEELTLFAPSAEALEDATLPTDEAGASALLRGHLVEGALGVRDLIELDGSTVTTLGGDELVVEIGEDRSITVGGATVVKRQIDASNGVIYVIDSTVSP